MARPALGIGNNRWPLECAIRSCVTRWPTAHCFLRAMAAAIKPAHDMAHGGQRPALATRRQNPPGTML